MGVDDSNKVDLGGDSMSEKEQLYDLLNELAIDLKPFIKAVLDAAPYSFWTIPASSTGKYHPELSRGEGGLVRHTLAAVYMAKELFRAYDTTKAEEDTVIAALMIHDIGKAMAEPHDIVGATKLRYIAKDFDCPMAYAVIAGVRWHMGCWSTGSTHCAEAERGQKAFPHGFSKVEQIVHIADYVVSRKRFILEAA